MGFLVALNTNNIGLFLLCFHQERGSWWSRPFRLVWQTLWKISFKATNKTCKKTWFLWFEKISHTKIFSLVGSANYYKGFPSTIACISRLVITWQRSSYNVAARLLTELLVYDMALFILKGTMRPCKIVYIQLPPGVNFRISLKSLANTQMG